MASRDEPSTLRPVSMVGNVVVLAPRGPPSDEPARFAIGREPLKHSRLEPGHAHEQERDSDGRDGGATMRRTAWLVRSVGS